MTFTELYNRFPLSKRISISNCRQNPNYHPEIWVNKHIEQVFNNTCALVDYDLDLLIAALFHDIAKDDYTKSKLIASDDTSMRMYKLKINQIGHERGATKYVELYKDLFSDLDINWKKVEYICANHMKMHQYMDLQLKNKKKRNDMETNEFFIDLLKFSICDSYNPLKNNFVNSYIFELQNGKTLSVNFINGKYEIDLN